MKARTGGFDQLQILIQYTVTQGVGEEGSGVMQVSRNILQTDVQVVPQQTLRPTLTLSVFSLSPSHLEWNMFAHRL